MAVDFTSDFVDAEEESDGSKFPNLRADFIRHLSICSDEELLLLAFAVHALQQGQVKTAQLILRNGFPDHLVNVKIGDPGAIHGWEIETIVNELLTTSSSYRYVYALHPRLIHNSASAFSHIVNLLRALENEEYAYYDHDIRYELRRIMCRQFEWQRGFYNKTLVYRTALMFDGPECRKYLNETVGITLDDITFGAFALFAAFQSFAQVDRLLPTEHVGLRHDVRDKVFELFSADLITLRREAQNERAAYRSTAYRPSILRKYPCIRRSDNDRILISPLPELIMARASSGIFYDVISAGGSVRNEVGRGFESYCLRLLQRSYPECTVIPEFFYGPRRHRQVSPDVLLVQDEGISHIYECKAVRMSIEDKYAEGEFIGRGYDEIAKAVFQIWKFASHSRRGLTGRPLSQNCVGVVVLLDSWMTMVIDARTKVIERAEHLAANEVGVEAADHIPILFSEIGDLENVVMSLSFEDYGYLLSTALKNEYDGWLLGSILDSEKLAKTRRPFPFGDLNELVPWWGRVSKMNRSKTTVTEKE